MDIFKYFKKDREQIKEDFVTGIVREISSGLDEFTHSEQTEIVNRITLLIMSRKKDHRTKLLTEMRELQESMQTLKL